MCDWFLPGYLAGGPIQSIANLTAYLKDEFHFKIITTDRDFKSDKSYSDIKINQWTEYQGREVFYVSPDKLNPEFLLDLILSTPHDVIYLNSLFSKWFTIYPLKWIKQGKLNSRVVLAPRGMLGQGALAIKPLKKRMFLFMAKYSGYFGKILWQSTSVQETEEIKREISNKVKVFEVSNLPNLSKSSMHLTKEKNILKLCFISRISEKKNLKFVVDVLKEIRVGSILIDVYGPVEDNLYWKSCLKEAISLPKNIQFNYKGILKPEEVGLAISNYHALFLPTLNENYGHVIVEAFQHGRPVLISDQTPWKKLQENNVGFDISLENKTGFVNAINELRDMNDEKFHRMNESCLRYIEDKLDLNKIKQQYMTLFNS